MTLFIQNNSSSHKNTSTENLFPLENPTKIQQKHYFPIIEENQSSNSSSIQTKSVVMGLPTSIQGNSNYSSNNNRNNEEYQNHQDEFDNDKYNQQHYYLNNNYNSQSTSTASTAAPSPNNSQYNLGLYHNQNHSYYHYNNNNHSLTNLPYSNGSQRQLINSSSHLMSTENPNYHSDTETSLNNYNNNNNLYHNHQHNNNHYQHRHHQLSVLDKHSIKSNIMPNYYYSSSPFIDNNHNNSSTNSLDTTDISHHFQKIENNSNNNNNNKNSRYHNLNTMLDNFSETDISSLSSSYFQKTYCSFSSSSNSSSNNQQQQLKKELANWNSPTDKRNPKNWPLSKKWYVTLVTGYMGLCVSFGSSLYITATMRLMFAFGVSQERVLLGLTLYLLGLSLAPVIGTPLSERFGRKIVYLCSVPMSMVFIAGTAAATSMSTILVCRFFTGLFGSPVLAIAAGTIADLWDLDMLVCAMTVFSLAPFAGPVLGPIIGGYAMEKLKWQWTMYIQLIFSAASLPFVACMPETYKPTILKREAEKGKRELIKGQKQQQQQKEENDGNDKKGFHHMDIRYEEEKEEEMENGNQTTSKRQQIKQTLKTLPKSKLVKDIKESLIVTLLRPIQLLLFEGTILIGSVYTAFVFAILFAFLESYTYIFVGVYHFSPGQTGLTFLGIGAGLFLAALFFILLDRFYLQDMLKRAKEEKLKNSNNSSISNSSSSSKTVEGAAYDAPVAPERVLVIAKVGAILLPISLFWQGWSAQESVHWLIPACSGIPFGISLLFIFFSLIVYFEFSYSAEILASVFAANNLLRYVFASLFPLFTTQMYKALGVAWSASLFGFIALALVPIPWVFEIFGPRMRENSRYGKKIRKQKMIIEEQRKQEQEEQKNKRKDMSSMEEEDNSEFYDILLNSKHSTRIVMDEYPPIGQQQYYQHYQKPIINNDQGYYYGEDEDEEAIPSLVFDNSSEDFRKIDKKGI